MLSIDLSEHVAAHRQELLAEADRERLAARVPAPSGFDVRRELALVCYRLATWLEEPTQYVQRAEAGREHWAAP
jgi:hypothetical protein